MRILFVCLGNICRSAAAEAIMKSVVKKHGVEDDFYIDSAGILNYHQGEPADPRMRRHAKNRGYDVTSISRPVCASDFEDFDLIIGMDNSNVEDLLDRAYTLDQEKKVHLMTEYSVRFSERYVPDPYYGGDAGFEHVIDLLEDACEGLFSLLNEKFTV